ncbi:glycosyltransferase family 2 protein [Clostridium fungisolvens]|nr:glycosyltransferase family A protein [Clostridium fungisolvens]
MKKCMNTKDRNKSESFFVTVVIPYYNNCNTINRAIESVFRQTYKNYEIILMDDGSTDESFKVVENTLEKYPEIKALNLTQKNQGPSKARNECILRASGEYIAFLDADDEWLPEKLQRQIEILKSNDKIDLLGSNFYIKKDNQIEKKYFVKDDLVKITFDDMLFKHYYATPCVIVKKSVIVDCGLFNETQKYMEDSLLFTKIARKYNAYMTSDFLVYTYKLSFGESGLSGKINEMEKYELLNFLSLYRENRSNENKLSILLLVICLGFSLIKFIRRKIIVALR